jgi:hypothetical protein
MTGEPATRDRQSFAAVNMWHDESGSLRVQ